MKKEDRKYYALPDGTLREIPEGIYIPSCRPDYWNIDTKEEADAFENAIFDFMDIIKQQPAIYTDEKFPVGLVEGIEVEYQACHQIFEPDWQKVNKDVYESVDAPYRRILATRKREEVNTLFKELHDYFGGGVDGYATAQMVIEIFKKHSR